MKKNDRARRAAKAPGKAKPPIAVPQPATPQVAAGVAAITGEGTPGTVDRANGTIVANHVPPPQSTPRQPSGPGEVLGDVTWLMSQSPAHKHLFLADLEWLVAPAVMAKQFRLFKNGDRPFAYASWALLDEEAEKRLVGGQPRLRPGDWRSGDRLWLIDLVAPFGGQDGVLKHLKENLFADRKLMALRRNPNGGGMQAGEIGIGEKKEEGATVSASPSSTAILQLS